MESHGGSRISFSTLAAAAIAAIAIAAYQSIAPSPLQALMPGAGPIAAVARIASPLTSSPLSEPAILALFGAGLIVGAGRLKRRKEA